jgi:hypothetical protein
MIERKKNFEYTKGVTSRPKSKDRQYNGQKEEGQTIQWPKEEGQTIQWPKEEGQTIQ